MRFSTRSHTATNRSARILTFEPRGWIDQTGAGRMSCPQDGDAITSPVRRKPPKVWFCQAGHVVRANVIQNHESRFRAVATATASRSVATACVERSPCVSLRCHPPRSRMPANALFTGRRRFHACSAVCGCRSNPRLASLSPSARWINCIQLPVFQTCDHNRRQTHLCTLRARPRPLSGRSAQPGPGNSFSVPIRCSCIQGSLARLRPNGV